MLRVEQDLTQKDLVTFHRKIALEVLRGVVLKTPVDIGRARGGWQITIGNPAEGENIPAIGWGQKAPLTSRSGVGPGGARSLDTGLTALLNLKPFDIIWISNNVPYIEFLEMGSSTQAPMGMLALTLEEITRIFP